MSSKKYSFKKIIFVLLIISVLFISGCASQQGSQPASAKTPADAKTGQSPGGASAGSDQSVPMPPAIPE